MELTVRIPQAAIDAVFAYVLPGREDRTEMQGLFNTSTGDGTYRQVQMTAEQADSLIDDALRAANQLGSNAAAKASLRQFVTALRAPPRG